MGRTLHQLDMLTLENTRLGALAGWAERTAMLLHNDARLTHLQQFKHLTPSEQEQHMLEQMARYDALATQAPEEES